VLKVKKLGSATLEKAFGRVLSTRRESKGMSQAELALASGYSLRYIGDIERGTKSATIRTLNDFAIVFEVRLGVLITEAEKLVAKDSKKANRADPKVKR
jgi:transcriptional regulator with XRE-family HTH domain